MCAVGGALDHDLAKVLTGLTTRGCPARITDERLVRNGFEVVIFMTGAQQMSSIRLDGKCPDMDYYGVADLIQIVQVTGRKSLLLVRWYTVLIYYSTP